MRAGDGKTWIFLGCLLAVLAGVARAQSRQDVNISTPGAIRDVGQSGSSRTFSSYSYGLGGLSGASPAGPGSTVLQSAVSSPGSFSIGKSPAGGGLNVAQPITPAAVGQAYKGVTVNYGEYSGAGMGKVLAKVDNATLAAAGYVEAIRNVGGDIAGRTEPITSFVPSQPSMYTNYMAEGEKLLKAGQAAQAISQFRQANHLGGKDPESWLSLLHANFAISRVGYSETAFCLVTALSYLPELPTVPLRPRAFFGSDAAFATYLFDLEDYLVKSPYDADAQLVLAYFRWFDGDAKTAHNALALALAHTRDPKLTEAIATFWDGMVATGKVSGKLEPAPRPATRKSP